MERDFYSNNGGKPTRFYLNQTVFYTGKYEITELLKIQSLL